MRRERRRKDKTEDNNSSLPHLNMVREAFLCGHCILNSIADVCALLRDQFGGCYRFADVNSPWRLQ